MAKKWAISDGPPLKVRLAGMKESDQDRDRVRDKPIRVKTVARRIVKVIVTLWVLSVGALLQACYGSDHTTNNVDGAHDSIDGHSDPFNAI